MDLLSSPQLLFSLLINAVALTVVFSMPLAPPRVLLWICVAGMSAFFVPWSFIGTGVGAYVPLDVVRVVDVSSVPPVAVAHSSFSEVLWLGLMALWLGVAAVWLVFSFTRSMRARRFWRLSAESANELAQQADSEFAAPLARTSIHRLPDSSSVFATGYFRPEVWIGSKVISPAQIRTALNHELSHIAANDQLTLLLIVVLERLLWWNPLIWWLGKQARRQMEYACDARCKSLMGAKTYRESLAELFLQQRPRQVALQVPLGSHSDIINRLEKIGMTYVLKPQHIVSLALGSALITLGSTALAGEIGDQPSTLIQCHKLVPEGVQYDFKITSDIDTRAGQQGQLSVTLVDAANPDSTELPEGAGEFLRCVQKLVGVGKNEGWPEA